MKQEEIEIFKDIRGVLSDAIDRLEALGAEKKPREFWLEPYFPDSNLRYLVHEKKPIISVEALLHVREVVE